MNERKRKRERETVRESGTEADRGVYTRAAFGFIPPPS